MKLVTILLAASALVAAGSAAAKADDESMLPDDICVSGRQWHAAPEDGVRIEQITVPQAYRDLFESTKPCEKWALNKEELVNWHLRTGTARSTAPALAYLEADYTRDFPDTARYGAALRRAGKAALGDMRQAAAIPHNGDRARLMRASRTITRFNQLRAMEGHYLFLAERYLDAAEEFQDPAFLAKAELYLTAARQGDQDPNSPRAKVIPVIVQHDVGRDNLRVRAVLLRAQLSRDDKDIAAAGLLLAADGAPDSIIRSAIQTAVGEGVPLCVITDHVEDPRIAQACKDYSFAEKAFDYAMNSASLAFNTSAPAGTSVDALMADWLEPFRDAQKLIRLKEVQRITNTAGPVFFDRRPDPNAYRLLMAGSIASLRNFKSFPLPDPPAASWQDMTDDQRAALDRWNLAMNFAAELVRTVSPEDEPGRFSRAATQWLALWRLRDRFDGDNRREAIGFAAYLETLLSHLDVIRGGASQ